MAYPERSKQLLLPTCCVFMLAATSAQRACGQIDSVVLQKIKDATVLIKAGSGEKATSGSGFVVWSDDQYSLIATNAHVVEEHLKLPSSPFVECIFNSGQPNEKSIRAQVYGLSELDDLALLKAFDLRNAAKIEADGSIVPSETQRVYAAGFPYGEMLGVGNRNPNLTITETGITSIRQLDSGMPEILQTSGGIDPGNSGGPVVDQSGRLVGISVAKIRESSIGFAIPTWKLQELLPPSMSDIVLTKRPSEKEYRCSVNLSGLHNSGQTQLPELVGLKYAEEQQIDARFERGSWTSVPGLKPIRWAMLPTENKSHIRTHTVRIELDRIEGAGDQYVFQWRLQTGVDRKSGTKQYRYSRPLMISRADIESAEKAMAAKPSSPNAASAARQAELPRETIIEFDAYIRRCMPAGGGRYLVLPLANDDIAVVDLATKQQVAKINDPAANMVVAGKTSVVTFNKADRSMTSYRLPKLQSQGTKEIRDNPIVRFADWGADTVGPIVAVIQPSGAKSLACVLIDPGSGKVSRFSLEGERRQRGKPPLSILDVMPTSGEFEVRMNETGNVVTMWLNNTKKPQVHVMRKGRRQWTHDFFSEGAAYGHAGPSGKMVFSTEAVLAGDLGKLHDAALSLPTLHDDYFLTLGGIEMADPNAPRSGPITTYDKSVKHVANFTWHLASVSTARVHRSWTFQADLNEEVVSLPTGAGIPLEERFLCVPQYNVLATVLPEFFRGKSKRLRLYDLGETLPGVDASDPEQRTVAEASETDQPAFRKWTDKTGKYSLEASVVAVKQGYVKLKKKDGSTIVLPIGKLSSSDQDYLQENTR